MKYLPILRNDLEFVLFEQDGFQYILLSDPHRYVSEPYVLHYEAFELLTYFSGEFTEEDLRTEIVKISDQKKLADELLQLIQQLDDDGFMLSDNFFKRKAQMDADYLDLPSRPPICASGSYPEDKDELLTFLNSFISILPDPDVKKLAKGIIAPHIDMSLGKSVGDCYTAAYKAIDKTADVYVILGTSHYEASEYFTAAKKPYATPLGVTDIDIELLQDILLNSPQGIEINDLAHRIEHSLEYHVLILQYLLQDRDFKILPIICGGFLHEKGDDNTEELKIVDEALSAIKNTIKASGKKVVFIGSADLSHIGKKFDDEYDAVDQLAEMQKADKKLLEVIKSEDALEFLKTIRETSNRWNICGVAPIFSLMKLLPDSEKEILNYAYNMEVDTQSAVSFASIALY